VSKAGDAIRKIANASFFIGFTRAEKRRSPFIEPDRAGEVEMRKTILTILASAVLAASTAQIAAAA